MTTLYGIKNCDTVKKARKWLDQANIEYQFHDFRSDGLEAQLVQSWADTLGWKNLLNKRSTTWRQLPDGEKESVNEKNIIQLLLQHPTLIKRPVLSTNGQLQLGFKEQDYQQLFA